MDEPKGKPEKKERSFEQDRRRMFWIEFLMISVFSAFVLYCFWQNGR